MYPGDTCVLLVENISNTIIFAQYSNQTFVNSTIIMIDEYTKCLPKYYELLKLKEGGKLEIKQKRKRGRPRKNGK